MSGGAEKPPRLEEIQTRASDGLTLRGWRWAARQDGVSSGQILLLHGLGDHTGRHLHVAAALAAAGLGGVMFDQRGHGRSGGRQGDAPDFSLFIRDAGLMTAALDPQLPRGLLAFSFGGQIAAAHLLETRGQGWRCAALVAPWFRLRVKPAPWQLFLARTAARVAPGFRQKTRLRAEQMSSDMAHLEAIDPARLTHGWISARLYFGAVANGQAALDRAPEISLPLAVWHGADDPVTCPRASEEFVSRLGSADRQFRLLPGIRHEPHNEAGRAAFLAELAAWLAARVFGGGAASGG